jgi:hypothetical protein
MRRPVNSAPQSAHLTAGESGALCLLALAGAASLYADLACMALTLVIIHTFHSLAVNLTAWRRLSGYIAVGIALSLYKAIAAGFGRALRLIPAYLNFIQVTIKFFIMGASLHCTF